MGLHEGGRRRGNVESVQFKLGTEKERERDREPLSAIEELIQRLGDGGKCKVFRVVEGEHNYCKTLDVDHQFAGEMEEIIAAQCGGGVYNLRFFLKGKQLDGGHYSLRIDEKLIPPRKTEVENKREGLNPDGSPPTSQVVKDVLREFMPYMAAMQAKQAGAAGAMDQTAMLALLMQQQQQAQKNAIDLVAALAGRPAQGAAPGGGDFASQFKQTVAMLRDVQQLTGAGPAAERSLLERVTEPGLIKAGEVVANRLADVFDPKPAPKPAEAPTASAKPPPLPPASGPITPPRGSVKMSPEQLAEARRRRQEDGQRPPPAPRAGDVIPSATTEKK